MSDKGRDEMKPGDEAPPGEQSAGPGLCPDCDGHGRRNGDSCPTCEGTGQVQQGIGGA